MAVGDRSNAVTIVFAGLGDGSVVRSTPPENLIAPTPNRVVAPTPVPTATNVELYEGEVRRYRGYAALAGSAPNALPVTGVFNAIFSNGVNRRVRCTAASGGTPGTIHWYSEASSSWIDITGAATITADASHPWTFAMVPRVGDDSPNQLMFCNGVDAILVWDGTGNARPLTDTNAPTGARHIVAFLGRAFLFNVVDSASGNRSTFRTQWSAVGDGSDFSTLGTGYADLTDDPFPIVNAHVAGGRLAIHKGGDEGGAIYVATPTGSSIVPLRFDSINPGTGIGVFLPRSVVPITSTQSFFLGTDAFYLYDGVRALVPFAEGTARDIINRANPDALRSGFAMYNRLRGEIELHIATGAATQPNESWTIVPRTRRVYGPHTAADTFLSGGPWRAPGALSWDTWAPASTWDTIPYATWDEITGNASATYDVLVTASGDVVIRDPDAPATTYDGTAIDCEYRLPPVTPFMWISGRPDGRAGATDRAGRADDYLALRTVQLRHRSNAAWVPVVEVSVDGGATWTLFSNGSTIGSTDGKLATQTYTGIVPGTWFQLRVRNTAGDALTFHSILMEFTYVGNARHA